MTRADTTPRRRPIANTPSRTTARRPRSAITKIINQNEPFASDWGECMPTPPFAEPNAAGGYLLNISTFSVHPKDAKGEPLVAANSAQQHGTKNAPCSEGGLCVGFIEHGHWLRFDNVDFGAGGGHLRGARRRAIARGRDRTASGLAGGARARRLHR